MADLEPGRPPSPGELCLHVLASVCRPAAHGRGTASVMRSSRGFMAVAGSSVSESRDISAWIRRVDRLSMRADKNRPHTASHMGIANSAWESIRWRQYIASRSSRTT